MSYRLLVVTQQSDLLRALPGQLGDVDVKMLDSANDALWELQANPPEAVIAEVDLPDMTGLELAEILPNFELPTRVLLWSPAPSDSLRQQAAAVGVYRFFDSTTTSDVLHAALRAAMDEAHHAPRPEPEPLPPAPPPPAPKAERPAFTAARITLPTAEEREAEQRAAEKNDKPAFTPARVTLPSAAETRNAPPAPLPARGGLGSRAKAAAEKVERNEKPASAPAPSSSPGLGQRRGSDTLVVTVENINPIRSVMSQLGQDLGAQSIMLTDRAGMMLVEVGNTDGLPMMILLPLLSTSFSTAGEVSRQLRDEDATTLYIHEGINIDLYCFNVVQRFLLVLVFNKKVASSKIGAVWVNAKRAIRELRELLSKA